MTEFAHKYTNTEKAVIESNVDSNAAYTLICHRADGAIETLDTNDLFSLRTEMDAIDKAMYAIKDYDDSCDVYWYGEYFGTAEYVDTNPSGFFSNMQVVFSTYC